jgi:hypothetical protein
MLGSLQQPQLLKFKFERDSHIRTGGEAGAAPEASSFFRTPQRVIFFAISGLKWHF